MTYLGSRQRWLLHHLRKHRTTTIRQVTDQEEMGHGASSLSQSMTALVIKGLVEIVGAAPTAGRHANLFALTPDGMRAVKAGL